MPIFVTTFLLIRHAAHDLLGKRIAGRMPGVHLNETGKKQALWLAEQLAHLEIHAIYSGPLERARETAEPLCNQFGLELQIVPEFDEIDFGDWTNCAFEELDPQPHWQRFNSFRSATAPPNGELMLEVQTRVIGKLRTICEHHQTVAVVSHGDVIRVTLAHFLGIHLDLFQRLEISPASVSVLDLDEHWVHVRLVNGAAWDRSCSGAL